MNHEQLQKLAGETLKAGHDAMKKDRLYDAFFRGQAEVLNDPALVDEITEYLSTKPEDKDRQNCYLLLGRIGRNIRSHDCAVTLLKCLESEASEIPLLYLLGALDEVGIPDDVNLSKLIDCLNDDRPLVRQPAIRALRKTPPGAAEEAVLALLMHTKDLDDICNCHKTLGRIGTEKSVQSIECNLSSDNDNVKGTAANAIARIRERLETAKLIFAGGNA